MDDFTLDMDMTRPLNAKLTNPIKAIRAKCIDCSGGSAREATNCWAKGCPIWAFRTGKNPYRKKRDISEATYAALSKHRKNVSDQKTLTTVSDFQQGGASEVSG